MQSQPTDKDQSLLNHLECPVCLEYMRPPITLCANGHKICDNCENKLNLCPICSGQFVTARNLALEDVARHVMYPCKFRPYGCTEIFEHDKIVGHQATCLYSQQVCPVAKLAFGTCSWTGSYKDIKVHLQENHSEVCCEYVEGDIKFMYNLTVGMKLFCFILAYNEIFVPVFQEKDNVFYAVVLYVGAAEKAAKYKYRVEFVNEDDTEGVTVMHLTRSSVENLFNIYTYGRCGKLHYDVVGRLANTMSRLKYKIEILKAGD